MFVEERMNCEAIGRHPDIQRSGSRVRRWKYAGDWETEKKKQSLVLLRQSEKAEQEELEIGLARTKAVIRNLGVDDNPDVPLTPADFTTLTTYIFKRLLLQVVEDIELGNVKYKDPYQVHQLMESLLKEGHLARNEPTEIHEHREKILPEDDSKALAEGLRRLLTIRDRRNRPLIEAEVVEAD